MTNFLLQGEVVLHFVRSG